MAGQTISTKGAILLAILGAVTASGTDVAAAVPVEPSPETVQGLDLLHQGRFRMASESFARVSRSKPGDPEGPLFEGLTTWWKLLDDPRDPRLLEELQVHLSEAIRRGEALLDTRESQRGRILAGTALILAAQAHVAQKNYLEGGRAARAGHEYLEQALAVDPGATDAWFALGAYKYFADRLSWLVKLLRFIIRIPGGDQDAGLSGLHRAASSGRFFSSESNLLLAYIYSSEHEDDYRQALHYLESARKTTPVSPLYDVIESRFLFSLGRLSGAEIKARSSIELSEELTGVARQVRDASRVRLSLALYYQYRHDEAREALVPLGLPDAVVPAVSRKLFDSLRARLDQDEEDEMPLSRPVTEPAGTAVEDPVRPIAAAPLPRSPVPARAVERIRLGETGEAVKTLEEWVAGHPNDMISRYHLARAYMETGEAEKATAHLQVVVGPDARIPRTLRGWALLRLGSNLEAMGRRVEAQGWYRKSSELKGFVFRRAADDRLRYPETVPLEG